MTERGEPVPLGEAGEGRGHISPLRLLALLVRERRLVLALTGVGVVIGTGIALLRPRTYTSTFSFVQQSTQDPSRAGLASLAGQFGVSLGSLAGSSQSPQLYADLLTTRAVLAPIAAESVEVAGKGGDREPLSRFLRVRAASPAVVVEKTLRALRKDVISSRVAATTTGMVTVNVRTRSPKVSFDVAQRLLTDLNDFNVVTRQSQAGEERRFIEGRYNAAQDSLRVAENALQQFLQSNRQFANSPQLTFARDRLLQNVTLQQQIVTSLAQQFEEARIREIRDTPVITVIERPTIPALPDPQFRALIVLLSAFAFFSLSVLIALFRDTRGRARSLEKNPAEAFRSNEWNRMRGVGAG